MQAVNRTPLNKLAHDLFNIAWPILLLVAVGGPIYCLASLSLNADQMTSLDDTIRLTAMCVIKIGAAVFGGLAAFGLVTIVMALDTGVRTIRQCAPIFLGSIFFAFMFYLMLTA